MVRCNLNKDGATFGGSPFFHSKSKKMSTITLKLATEKLATSRFLEKKSKFFVDSKVAN
jgi:hypothetical protein